MTQSLKALALIVVGAVAITSTIVFFARTDGRTPEVRADATANSQVSSNSVVEADGAPNHAAGTALASRDHVAGSSLKGGEAGDSRVALVSPDASENIASNAIEPQRQEELLAPKLDRSVEGRPFPIAQEAKPFCKGGENPECADAQRLEKFAGEARDLEWAAASEKILRVQVEQQNAGFTIRNLECRLATCLLEVTSPNGLFTARNDLEYDDSIASNLMSGSTRVARLVDANGVPQYLTLQMYERRR